MSEEIKPQEDLVLEQSNETSLEAEILEDGEVEYTTRIDYITAAYSAISAVDGMDTQIMSKEDAKRVKRIIRKSLMIIDDCITEMYDELFEKGEDDDD